MPQYELEDFVSQTVPLPVEVHLLREAPTDENDWTTFNEPDYLGYASQSVYPVPLPHGTLDRQWFATIAFTFGYAGAVDLPVWGFWAETSVNGGRQLLFWGEFPANQQRLSYGDNWFQLDLSAAVPLYF